MCTVYRHNKKGSTRWLLQSSSRPHTLSARQIARQPRVDPSIARASLNLDLLGHAKTQCQRKPFDWPERCHVVALERAALQTAIVLVIYGRDHFLTTRAPPLCVKEQKDGMYCHHFGLTSPASTTLKCTYKAFRNLPQKLTRQELNFFRQTTVLSANVVVLHFQLKMYFFTMLRRFSCYQKA